jgi:malate dehydrogenase (oxaloacetate-decarboxylating)(NADP+)
LPLENIWVTDIVGVVWKGRTELMDENKARYARETSARHLEEVIEGADLFLGLSAGKVLTQAMVERMAPRPVIFALANPEPEIAPPLVKEVRPDAIIATGRSDYPNQVNNVLCFPFIFRGALDVGATQINEAMKLAAVRAIADLAMAEQSEVVTAAYGDPDLRFGPEYLIPRPFDPRLIMTIAPAVARAAMESGVATRPITDFEAYQGQLEQFVYASGFLVRPLFAAARKNPRRVVYAAGEDERVLRAVSAVREERLAHPILIGRPSVIEQRIERLGLRLKAGVDFELVNPEWDSRYREYWEDYHRIAGRRGVSVDQAKLEMRRQHTLIGAMMVQRGDADGMLCGMSDSHAAHLHYIDQVIGRRQGVKHFYAMNALMLPERTLFICDTYVHYEPSAEQIAEMTALAAEEIRRFGIVPRAALLSHSSFGTHDTPSAVRLRDALALIRARNPELEVDGEMHGDAALSEPARMLAMPASALRGEANLLIMPTLDAANIAFNLLKQTVGSGITLGPILLGAARPVHILTPTTTARRLVNMTALTVVDINAGRR